MSRKVGRRKSDKIASFLRELGEYTTVNLSVHRALIYTTKCVAKRALQRGMARHREEIPRHEDKPLAGR